MSQDPNNLRIIAAAVFHFLLLAILISLQLLLLEVCDPEVNLQIILQNGKEDGDPVYSKKASDDPVLHTYFAFNVESIPPLIYMQKM